MDCALFEPFFASDFDRFEPSADVPISPSPSFPSSETFGPLLRESTDDFFAPFDLDQNGQLWDGFFLEMQAQTPHADAGMVQNGSGQPHDHNYDPLDFDDAWMQDDAPNFEYVSPNVQEAQEQVGEQELINGQVVQEQANYHYQHQEQHQHEQHQQEQQQQEYASQHQHLDQHQQQPAQMPITLADDAQSPKLPHLIIALEVYWNTVRKTAQGLENVHGEIRTALWRKYANEIKTFVFLRLRNNQSGFNEIVLHNSNVVLVLYKRRKGTDDDLVPATGMYTRSLKGNGIVFCGDKENGRCKYEYFLGIQSAADYHSIEWKVEDQKLSNRKYLPVNIVSKELFQRTNNHTATANEVVKRRCKKSKSTKAKKTIKNTNAPLPAIRKGRSGSARRPNTAAHDMASKMMMYEGVSSMAEIVCNA